MSPQLAGASPWSLAQRQWLQALGHVVYRHGEIEAAPAPAGVVAGPGVDLAPAVAPVQQRHGPAQPRDDAPRRAPALDEPAAPARRRADAPSAPVQAERPAARRVPRLPDRLQLAMLRASGLDPSDPAAQAAMAQWLRDALRNDPAAKRAFWPQLRALRKRP